MDDTIQTAISGAVQDLGSNIGPALMKTIKHLFFLLKSQHNTRFQINPATEYPTFGWQRHTSVSTPPGQALLLSSVLLASSWTWGLTSLRINSAKTTGGDQVQPVPCLAHSGFWPHTSNGQQGGSPDEGSANPAHCQKWLCKQGP